MIEKLLKFLKIHFASTTSLIDGTNLSLSGDLETGTRVNVITSDGEIPLPDGEYKLYNGMIILVKDGFIMDVINPDVVEEVMATQIAMSSEAPELIEDEMATQKENPDVTGDPIIKEDELPEITGTTIEEEIPAEMVDMPIEDPMVEPIDEEEVKIAELEAKISGLETAIGEILAKLNMISEKFSVATPITKVKSDNKMEVDDKIQAKVNLINMLKKH